MTLIAIHAVGIYSVVPDARAGCLAGLVEAWWCVHVTVARATARGVRGAGSRAGRLASRGTGSSLPLSATIASYHLPGLGQMLLWHGDRVGTCFLLGSFMIVGVRDAPAAAGLSSGRPATRADWHTPWPVTILGGLRAGRRPRHLAAACTQQPGHVALPACWSCCLLRLGQVHGLTRMHVADSAAYSYVRLCQSTDAFQVAGMLWHRAGPLILRWSVACHLHQCIVAQVYTYLLVGVTVSAAAPACLVW